MFFERVRLVPRAARKGTKEEIVGNDQFLVEEPKLVLKRIRSKTDRRYEKKRQSQGVKFGLLRLSAARGIIDATLLKTLKNKLFCKLT
jgi:hypothetical protein